MIDTRFPGSQLSQPLVEGLLSSVAKNRVLWCPQPGKDGHYRLQRHKGGALPRVATPTLLPIKKVLLPAEEAVWEYQSGRFTAAKEPEPFAVVGVPLCDLQAVWYLDQAFADDEGYQERRAKSLLIGMECNPAQECSCDGNLMPLSGDIFIGSDWLWALSPAGLKLLNACKCKLEDARALPWPTGSEQRPVLTREQFTAPAADAVYQEEARHCLSCGACSVVCPTCYCFDMLDDIALDGRVTRNRVWDNCFFAEHGKVAGDYDFRPGRTNRLRFRMEHKLFGFGSLRGQNSCVGCGRCRKACPVDIDLDRIVARLREECNS